MSNGIYIIDIHFEGITLYLDVGRKHTIKLAFATFLLSTQHYVVSAKGGWPEIRITCPSGIPCLLATLPNVLLYQ